MTKSIRIAILTVMSLTLLDQLTKWLVALSIAQGTKGSAGITIIPNFIYLGHTRNAGAAWGMFQGQLTFFIIITLVALAVFITLARDLDFKKRTIFSIALTLLIAGAIGNFIDRLARGEVIDFIDTYIFGYDFPVFNVADICLTIGMALFAFDMLVIEPRREPNHENAQA